MLATDNNVGVPFFSWLPLEVLEQIALAVDSVLSLVALCQTCAGARDMVYSLRWWPPPMTASFLVPHEMPTKEEFFSRCHVRTMVRSASFRQAFPQSLLDADLAARLCFAARLCVDAHIDLPTGTRFRVASCAGVGSPYNDYRIIGCPARYRALGVVWLGIAGPPHHLAYGAKREGAVVMDNGTYFRGDVDHCLLLDLSLLAGAVTYRVRIGPIVRGRLGATQVFKTWPPSTNVVEGTLEIAVNAESYTFIDGTSAVRLHERTATSPALWRISNSPLGVTFEGVWSTALHEPISGRFQRRNTATGVLEVQAVGSFGRGVTVILRYTHGANGSLFLRMEVCDRSCSLKGPEGDFELGASNPTLIYSAHIKRRRGAPTVSCSTVSTLECSTSTGRLHCDLCRDGQLDSAFGVTYRSIAEPVSICRRFYFCYGDWARDLECLARSSMVVDDVDFDISKDEHKAA